MSKERPLHSMARCVRVLATLGFNRMALRGTQPKLHSMFCTLFLKIALANNVWPSWSCDLTPLDSYLWGAVKSKCYADKPETIYALKDNIREAIGEIQLHTIDNMLKNWTDRVGYCIANRGSHLNKLFSITCTIVLSNKIRNLSKYSIVFFLKNFPKKKIRYLADPV